MYGNSLIATEDYGFSNGIIITHINIAFYGLGID